MKDLVLYLHGKGGSPAEAAHYRPIFPHADVVGLDGRVQTPWEAREVLPRLAAPHLDGHGRVTLIANSIGAFLAMQALGGLPFAAAFFLSPIVDMEGMILGMLASVGETEASLRARGTIPTPWGEPLEWRYLADVRSHPIEWHVPTQIICGAHDEMTPLPTMTAFAERIGAGLTVLPDSAHWLHTPEELQAIDRWLLAHRPG